MKIKSSINISFIFILLINFLFTQTKSQVCGKKCQEGFICGDAMVRTTADISRDEKKALDNASKRMAK